MNLLFESSLGFALFELATADEIGIQLAEVQKSIEDLGKFSKMVKLKSFLPFTSAESALENINAISEGEITKYLADWLELNVKSPTQLGVIDPKVGSAIQETLKIKCKCNELTNELMRGIRMHFVRYLKGVSTSELHQAQLGLCHSYSRSKVKFNVHRLDTMIIQSISLLDQLDKDVNTITMRAREWYGMHFPELAKVVNDNVQYCKVAQLIGDRKNLTKPGAFDDLVNIVDSDELAQQIIDAGKMSMGTDLSELDWLHVRGFVDRVVSLHQYRSKLYDYLCSKMNTCAPNLTAVIGELIGARLISKAGSLTSLAKYPASTVQILGAEKSLFRSIKTKSKTPKHGLLFNSGFIGRASAKDKGRIARTAANKCSIAARIDCFSDDLSLTNVYGEQLRQQIEERLQFFKSGSAPRKNVEAMDAAKRAYQEFEQSMGDASN